MEEIVTFLNNKNKKLVGILHTPEKNVKNIGINLLNIGSDRRTGPARLNIKIARNLVKQGFHVFRFDVTGVGDSEGDISNNSNESKLNLFGEIQKGKFLSDTMSANTVFKQKTKIKNLVMMGISGGAATSILMGKYDKDIDAVIAVSLSVNVMSSNVTHFDSISTSTKPEDLLFFYSRKLFSRKSWKNLLTANSDFLSVVPRMYKLILTKTLNKVQNKQEENPLSRFNKPLFDAFTGFMKKKKKVYLIYPEIDDITREFQHDWQSGFINNNEQYKALTKVHIIKNTSHLFTDHKSRTDQIELFKTIDRYMEDFYKYTIQNKTKQVEEKDSVLDIFDLEQGIVT